MVTGGRYEDVLINRDFTARTRTKDDAVGNYRPIDLAPRAVRYDMTDSGNIHIYVTVDGKEKRRVFTKRSKYYEKMLRAMRGEMPERELEEMLKEIGLGGQRNRQP